MNIVQFTSLINILPCLYPTIKILQKKELSIFDFLILTSSLYFAIIPFYNPNTINYNNENIVSLFYFYTLYIYTLLIYTIYWNHNFSNKKTIINITKYLKYNYTIKINQKGYIIISICIIILFIYYLPHSTTIIQLNNTSQLSYFENSLLMILTQVNSFIGFIILIDINHMIKTKATKPQIILFFAIYLILSAFLPRRYLILKIIEFFIIFYSINRKYFNKRNVVVFSSIISFILFIYFPFYNVFRHNGIDYNTSNPIASLTNIVNYGKDNYKYDIKKARVSTENRACGVYNAIYYLINNKPSPQYGKLTMSAIDVAIPKVIHPNKGNGTEVILEKMTNRNKDIADSFFLLSYGEFHIIGGVYTFILFFIFIKLYEKYALFFTKTMSSKIIPLLILNSMFSFCWNIEGKVETCISWFFSSFIIIVVFLILEKYKIIYFINRHMIKRLLMYKKYHSIDNL